MEARKCKDCGKVLYSSEGSEEWECKCGSIMTEADEVPLESEEDNG